MSRTEAYDAAVAAGEKTTEVVSTLAGYEPVFVNVDMQESGKQSSTYTRQVVMFARRDPRNATATNPKGYEYLKKKDGSQFALPANMYLGINMQPSALPTNEHYRARVFPNVDGNGKITGFVLLAEPTYYANTVQEAEARFNQSGGNATANGIASAFRGWPGQTQLQGSLKSLELAIRRKYKSVTGRPMKGFTD